MNNVYSTLRILVVILVGAIMLPATPPPHDGGGDTGTVILPTLAQRGPMDPAGSRGSWHVACASGGLDVILPTNMNRGAATLTTPHGGYSESFPFENRTISLSGELLHDLEASGVPHIIVRAVDVSGRWMVDLKISFDQSGPGLTVEAR